MTNACGSYSELHRDPASAGEIVRNPVRKPALDGGLDHTLAVAGVGVAAHELRLAAGAARLGEDAHHLEQGPGVVTGLGHEPHSESIRLQLVAAPVFQLHH